MFRSAILFLALAALFLAAPEASAKSIMVIHSGSNNDHWSESMEEGIDEIFPTRVMTGLWMGADQDDSEEHMEDVLDNLRLLLKVGTPDGVICDGHAALALFRKHGDELFPGVPAVFCAVPGRDRLPGQRPIPGVRAAYSAAETFERMLELHPKARTVVLVVDTTPLGKEIRTQTEAAFQKHMDRIHLIIPGQEAGRDQGIDREELLKIAEFMPRDGLILFGTFTRDKDDGQVCEDALARELVDHAKVPVYVLTGAHYGGGAVGGIMIAPETHGREAALLLRQLWDGANPEKLPVRVLANSETYNITALKRAGADVTKISGYEHVEAMQAALERALLYVGAVLGLFVLGALLVAVFRRMRR
ncbi:hypothetical protein [Salidesulfovibrio onnuriiensis]|uniref:hypothetical protein n=1 Tax=Salidesulfovibrio onnuriiensis TaxID=2583823 RepID=UPI0011CC0F01|nr:hypothetical protein [Salidesulfovibrio onnuriiensis]